MSARESPTQAEQAPRAAAAAHGRDAIALYERCLLAMAQAIQVVGIYGVEHPSARREIETWFKHLTPLLRSRGSLALGSDGQTAFVDGQPYSTTNPIIIALLHRLHAARAGILEILSGFRDEDAAQLAAFLAAVDINHLANGDRTIGAWIERNGMRHIRVKQLEFREIKEGDRIVSVRSQRARRQTPATDKANERQDAPKEAAAWARDFQEDAARDSAPPAFPPDMRDDLVGHLRGTSAAPAEALSACLTRTAEDAAPLASLILKTAVVEHEVARDSDRSVGHDVVSCLRRILDSLQQAPETQSEEGLTQLLQVLADLEQSILERLQALAGGNDADADFVRAGARDIEHDIKGAALKREHAQRLGALQDIERRIRQFFGTEGL